jgi:UDP-2,4-diacetamido-2,4,6-trideoxy-beta-L-altropyranose hydrolase|tara:strand:+ start:5880 stop:7466 length:1587 start_codon:yes stop_codon:yes gene_type:complete
MKEVIIRTNFSTKVGLGHLYRTKFLASKFKEQNYKVTFALDNQINIGKKILNFQHFFLYTKNSKFINQTRDAEILKEKIKKKNVKYIIVDDYRFDLKWEKFFYKKGEKVVVFDDLHNRKHLCDYIIDSRWLNIDSFASRYKNLVPKDCKRLLGPKYCLINPNFSKIKKKSKFLNLLLYFGGGGDFNFYTKFIIEFCSLIKNSAYKDKVIINIVIGPLSINYYKLNVLAKKNKFINLIKNNFDLSSVLSQTSLFFGTASSIINELNYLNIPSCLFSVSRNQRNNLRTFEDFGHYLFFENKEFKDTKKIAQLLKLLVKNYSRFKKLSNTKYIKIDRNGDQRITDQITQKNKYDKNKQPFIYQKKQKYYQGIKEVNDTLVNEYLESRNLIQNRKNSKNTKIINIIDHYIWWFKTKRKSFFLSRKGKIRMFISQELIYFKRKNFWVGGWFNSKNRCSIIDVMKALKWQLNSSFKICNCPWIVLIKRKNKTVYKINLLLGYKKIKKDIDKTEYRALKNFYNVKKTKNYFFLKK